MTMDEFVLWTWVVGGTPLALALIQRAAEWSRDAARARMIAHWPAAGERQGKSIV
jgi:hypothetical protein